jgi:hypothetical protein
MLPDNESTNTIRQTASQRKGWFKPVRCSICTHFIWLRSVALKEPSDAPEPRREWTLCKACHDVLLVEILRSSIPSPARLRIAMGLVAAERSPRAYSLKNSLREKQQFQREFTWFAWLLILFGLLHAVIFVVVWAVPH